jgi:hypothetical protein
MKIEISIQQQTLTVFDDLGEIKAQFSVSTAAKGAGNEKGSGCTPLGSHLIRAKIGAGAPLNAVFVARRATGEIWSHELAAAFSARDWVLTRILWLSGCEPGVNRLGNVDTMQRYIYIHGTPDDQPMGEPRSHGCVRMHSADIIELFDMVAVGTPVNIVESQTVEDLSA